jgi:hypothetical protein
MNEHELIIAAIATVLLLIIILIIFMVRKRISKQAKPIKDHKFPEPKMQAGENKLANKPILDTESKNEPLPEPQANDPLCSEPNSELIEEPQTNETVALAQKDCHENLPQDSMLRRHYLTNLRAMIESLKPPRPTDSTLSRHYDAMIIAEIEQCLGDQGAIERLICNYEDHKKTSSQQIQELKTIAEPLPKAEISLEDSVAQHEYPKLPEDSMLRRHYISNLYATVESNMPMRPTDSILRRHYDTMINTEVNKILGCKVVYTAHGQGCG